VPSVGAIEMITACMLLWCIGQSIEPSDRVTFTNDMWHTNRTERILAYEMSWLVGGVVAQTTAEDAVFAGALPLNIRLLGDRLTFTGGAVIASTTVPFAGTHANFTARLQLPLTDRFALTYWHWSNAYLGQHNPSVDSIGVTVRVPNR
jgi:Lipid A 3-O-deacylase (PagL)